MTTVQLTSYLRFALLFLGLQIFTEVAGQVVEIDISVDPAARTASVNGRLPERIRPWNSWQLAFVRQVAGFPDLGSRVRDLEVKDTHGSRVEVRRLQAGEYAATGEYTSWSSISDISPPPDRVGYAHASWVDATSGILMAGDLLPRLWNRNGKLPAHVRLRLPDEWEAVSADGTEASIESEDIHQSVVFIGSGLRPLEVDSKFGKVRLLISGEWHFTRQEAAQMAREIFDEYSEILGKLPARPYLIAIQRFPTNEQPGHWEAETRGRTVTIFSSDMPFRTQSLQRLHEQLRHEIFHLWFPNGIELIGDYAWFYEGFAMYSSLKLAVKLNRIRFEDFLDTLGRAYTIDANSKPRKALTDPNIDPTVRYARGMLIALMTDLETLEDSRGRNDVNERLRKLFMGVAYPRLPHGGLANDAVRTVVTDPSYFTKYIDGTEPIEWTAELRAAGIEMKESGRTSTLAVIARPNGRQKAILDRLGYNNWRKIGNRK